MTKDFVWVDHFKGLGILMVVAGHIWVGWAIHVIYLVHMPLFFFLSGYLFKPRTDTKSYFRDKWNALMVPYISYLVIFFLPELTWNSLERDASTHEVLVQLLKGLLGGRVLVGLCGVLWFVSCLFLTQQLINWVMNKLSTALTSCFMLLFCIFAYLNSQLLPQFWLPFNANVVLLSAPIFWVGYLTRVYDWKPVIWITVPTTIASMTSIWLGFDNFFDMKLGKYGIPLITLISSLLGLFILLDVAIAIGKLGKLSLPLKSIGQASMTLMFWHRAFIYLGENLGVKNSFLIFLFSVTASYVIHQLISCFDFTERYLAGKPAKSIAI